MSYVYDFDNPPRRTAVKEYTSRLVKTHTFSVIGDYDGRIDSPRKVFQLVKTYIGAMADREYMVMMMTDVTMKLIGINTVSVGTLSASLVHPREVFKPAILASAAGVVLSHNHPSGTMDPSEDDKETTRRLVQAGKLLGIPVLDHVLVDVIDNHFWSFREHGLL
jgi:DNA repair protein RadC